MLHAIRTDDVEAARAQARRSEQDRRAHPRVPLSLLVQLRRGEHGNAYGWMHDLSENGALVQSPRPESIGSEIELCSCVASLPTLRVAATVVRAGYGHEPRCVNLGLHFNERSPLAREIIAGVRCEGAPLRNESRRQDEQDGSVVIVACSRTTFDELAEVVAHLGRYPIEAHAPLDVIAWLEDHSTHITTLVASADRRWLEALELFDFVGSEYPNVRRVLVAQDEMPADLWPAIYFGRLDVVLREPVSADDLALAMGMSSYDIDPQCT